MLEVSLLTTLNMSLMWSEVSSLQFSYWLGQAGIVHIGLDQRVLTADSEIREKKMYLSTNQLQLQLGLRAPAYTNN